MKEPVTVEMCEVGLWMYKAVAQKTCMASEGFLPMSTPPFGSNGTETESAEDAFLEAVRSAGRLGVVVMLVLQLTVAEAVMLGALGRTVLTPKLFSCLRSVSGFVGVALVVWMLRYAGAYVAVRAVGLTGAEGVAAGGVAASAGAAVAAGAVALVAKRIARSYRKDILAKLAGATAGALSILMSLVIVLFQVSTM